MRSRGLRGQRGWNDTNFALFLLTGLILHKILISIMRQQCERKEPVSLMRFTELTSQTCCWNSGLEADVWLFFFFFLLWRLPVSPHFWDDNLVFHFHWEENFQTGNLFTYSLQPETSLWVDQNVDENNLATLRSVSEPSELIMCTAKKCLNQC